MEPQPANVPPIADAGPNQTVPVGATVTLDGRASTDPDNGPLPLSFTWSFVSVPAGSTATLAISTTVAPTFVPNQRGTYVVQLTVSDGAASRTAAVTITAFQANIPPIANAGPDQLNVFCCAPVTLDGTGSSDADNGPAPLSFSWSFLGGPGPAFRDLTGMSTATPTFTPLSAGPYVFRLWVHDGSTTSAPDDVTILVHPAEVLDRQRAHGVFRPKRPRRAAASVGTSPRGMKIMTPISTAPKARCS